MDKFLKIVQSYDALKDDDGFIDINKMTDEQIDEIISLQSDLADSLPALIQHNRNQNRIKLKAEKEEEASKKLINRIMNRLDIEDFDCEVGKVKATYLTKYEIDESKLSDEYWMPNHASLRSKVNKWEKIDWVVPIEKYKSVSIR